MKRTVAAIALGLAATLPSACANDIYGRGVVSWSSYPYYGWYDGFYGPFYDGYWGTDGFFYFRLTIGDTVFRRDRERHFRREAVRNNARFQRFERTFSPPPRGTRMPNFPHKRGARQGQ